MPFVLVSLALLVIAVAGACWAGWITIRNRDLDVMVRQRYEVIAASRGITIVDQPLLVLREQPSPVLFHLAAGSAWPLRPAGLD